MKMRLLQGGVLLVALGLVGCGSSEPVVQQDDGEGNTGLAESCDISLAEWLTKPRTELADMVKDKLFALRHEQEYARANPDSLDLLPNLKPSITLPIFQQATYSAKAGISIPTYAAHGKNDRDVALHLARHGDGEAAKRFADLDDAQLKQQLEALRGDRNYPLEWTQMVALEQVSAQFKLAGGDADGAATLVHLHRQLRDLLDKKAANGPLGALLLPVGRQALTAAAAAYREPRLNKKKLAADIESALKDWGPAPTAIANIEIGMQRDDLARIFRSPETGKILTAIKPEDRQRVLDLLAIPVMQEDVEGVIAFVDKDDRLSELLIYYFNTAGQQYPAPSQLIAGLTDAGVEGGELSKSNGILRQTFTVGKLSYEVNILKAASSGSSAAGAIIRVGDAQQTLPVAALPANARALGAVHLDRPFEQNRILLDPTAKPGKVVEITRRETIAKVAQPIVDPRPASIVLKKEGDFNLLSSLTVRWSSDENKHALATLLPPLWARYGAAQMAGVEDDRGGALTFVWENEQTRYTMRLPYADLEPPELIVADRRGPDAANSRVNATALFDVEQRKARFKADAPLERLPRSLYLPQIKLGMTRAQALAATPKREALRTTEIADGLNILVMLDAPKEATHWAKQLFIRFTPGKEGRVAEIRVRYQEGPAAPSAQAPSLYDLLRKAPNGEPEVLASTWANIWTDLPAKKFKPVLYRWVDDRTVMTYERDGGGSEVTLRDCPLEHPLGQPLPPLLFCSRGLPNVTLGEDRAEVLKRWHIEKPETLADGSVDLGDQPPDSRYEAVTVQFDNGKVSRIVARHRTKDGLDKEDIAAALQSVWSENLDYLGIVRRVDVLGRGDSALNQSFPCWGWNDDRTRVRSFGTDTETGPRLFTEWREWPIGGKAS